jgi:hypothetical protein
MMVQRETDKFIQNGEKYAKKHTTSHRKEEPVAWSVE